jgi:1-acyl-sn-glycerol-3-phosphate acyltransferase
MGRQIPTRIWVKILLCHFIYRVRYENKEKLQNVPRCVVCPNHTTIYDPFFIYNAQKWDNNIYIMAKSELFKSKIMQKIWKHYHVFPVDRNRIDVKSTLKAASVFEENKGNAQLLIFPEGKVITDPKEIGRVRNGAVYTAVNAGVPIVPVHICRKHHLFGKIKVTFGDKIDIDPKAKNDKELIIKESKRVLREIYKMEGLEID